MQVLLSSSPPPSSSLLHSHPHTSFKARRIPRALTPTSEANFPSVAMVTAPSRPNPRLGIVDLTESPNASYSSKPTLTRFPSFSSNSSTPKAARSRSPVRPFPPPSFSGFHCSKSSPTLPTAPPSLPPTHVALSARPESPHGKRATFLVSGDSDSDRERDRDGEAHDDSDDSDRTSFFSAEEYVVPANALQNAGGRVLGRKCSESTIEVTGWQKRQRQNLVQAVQEEHEAQPDSDQDAAHELRRWHALMEVVHSEVGYVRDLRVLVNVYLSLLPTLPLSSPALEAVQELARDAVDLLRLHERFAPALEVVSTQVVDGTCPRGSVDDAVRQLAKLFIDEASTFDLYQRFCSAQPDVMRLLRPAQARAEWAAFERRCATGGQDADVESVTEKEDFTEDTGDSQVGLTASGSTVVPQGPKISPRTMLLMPSVFKAHTPLAPSVDLPQTSNTRRHSYDSVPGVFGSGSGSIQHRPSVNRPRSNTLARSSTSVSTATSSYSRLRFHDFLIKPIQRICKYPLMLEGLRSKLRGNSTNSVVATAIESMRGVAMRVNEARQRRETAVKSKLIVNRIEPHPVVTFDFLNSLGDCLLSGSLDVVHHHQTLNPVTTPVRVKYLGGFLYCGGYLLLVKVGKRKTYRIKHWFSLAPFEIVDISLETALVPFSFRLSYMDHHFEVAVACKREKDLWLRAINEARTTPPSWNSEPVSSLQILHAAPALTPPAVDLNSLDTAEVSGTLKRGVSSASMSESYRPLSMLRLSSTKLRPSASTSTAVPTVRYIFSHIDETAILLHRSSSGNRTIVDRSLCDVLSDLVCSLREQALAQQEMLFPPPQLSGASQTIATAAKNKLMRRGSVLVAARPRGMTISGSASGNPDNDEDAGTSTSTLRPKSKSTCRRMALLPALSLLYTDPESMNAESESTAGVDLQLSKPAPTADAPSPPPVKRSLTIVTGRRTPPSSTSEGPDHKPHYHRRARSLVGSVKGLMRFGSIRSAPSPEASEAWRAICQPENSSNDKGESAETGPKIPVGRRRVSSAPTSPPLSTAGSTFFPYSDQESSTTVTSPDTPLPTPTLIDPPSPSGTSGSRLFGKKLATVPPHQTLKPRRSFKNFVFYNRLTTVDPA